MKIYKILPVLFSFSLPLVCVAQQQWPEVTQTAKPWTRWWWMGSAVDKAGVDKQLSQLGGAGFGGVQVVPIYGAKGYEDKYISYLTPDWMGMLDYTVSDAAKYGMGVDISVGTGWPIGGPQVTAEDAASKMVVQEYTLKAGEPFKDKIAITDEKQKGVPGVALSAVVAYNDKGKAEIIIDKVLADGTLKWNPKAGVYQIYALFTAKTGQKVKRAALGGEGFTLDHFSDVALGNYFKKFDTAFGGTSHGVRSFFNDSYEVYGANWTADFFTEFEKRQGYDLRPYIKYLVEKADDDVTTRVKADYRETMSALMLENFTQKFTAWANGKKAMNTNQAHGSPANLLDLYAAVDIPESETFGSTPFNIPGLRGAGAEAQEVGPDPSILKFSSSAANVMGKKLTSNETFTWLTEHFKTSWSQCKPEVEQVFLSGINHVFYHGTPYSPADAPFPGWLFYASVNFTPQNSMYPHLNGLNEYIARCQAILQSGQPDNDVLAYWPVYDSWMSAKGLDMPFGIHQIDNWLCPTVFYQNVSALQGMGYALDYASDKMLADAKVVNGQIKVNDNGAAYKVLVISKSNYMPVSTLENIIRLAKNGGVIVLQGFPDDVPGLDNLETNRKKLKDLIASIALVQKANGISAAALGKGKIIVSNDTAKGLAYANVEREALVDTGLKYIRRKTEDATYYYIVNHQDVEVDRFINFNTIATNAVLMDPQTGAIGTADFSKQTNSTGVRLQLVPGEAMFVKLSNNTPSGKDNWHYINSVEKPVTINSKWKLHFVSGGPEIPADRELAAPQLWTDFTDDVATQNFSGTAVYSTTFKLKKKKGDDYILTIDTLDESARVIINGHDAGIIWCVPFQLNIGKYLKKGENTIQIEVCNLMANRIRYMDKNKMEWRKYHEINFVNIKYKDFDASNWEVQPSGISGVNILPVDYK
ncbi:glycosyl hydrolase [Flavobacterium sp. RHBU_3]|uniref:glycosyl hydrolase n=1 Tax=Flavobacterium sp. RHBU_3 TaxID=3391184 RepID=UPI003984F55A